MAFQIQKEAALESKWTMETRYARKFTRVLGNNTCWLSKYQTQQNSTLHYTRCIRAISTPHGDVIWRALEICEDDMTSTQMQTFNIILPMNILPNE